MMPAVTTSSSNRVIPPVTSQRPSLPADSSMGAPSPLPEDPVDTSMQVDTAALPTDARGFLEQLGPVQAEVTAASWPLPLYPDQGGGGRFPAARVPIDTSMDLGSDGVLWEHEVVGEDYLGAMSQMFERFAVADDQETLVSPELREHPFVGWACTATTSRATRRRPLGP